MVLTVPSLGLFPRFTDIKLLVDHFMFSKIHFLMKFVTTNRTGMLFLGSMGHHVFVPISLQPEFSPANFTIERHFSRVCTQMSREVAFHAELFPTFGTFVFFPVVSDHVHLQGRAFCV